MLALVELQDEPRVGYPKVAWLEMLGQDEIPDTVAAMGLYRSDHTLLRRQEPSGNSTLRGDTGYDLECPSRKLFAGIKNKWNTMNPENRRKVIQDLETAARQKFKGWQGYLVQVIPKEPVRYEKVIAKNIKETDGASFYHIVTGKPDAIHDLFEYLCDKLNPSSDVAAPCREIMEASLPPGL